MKSSGKTIRSGFWDAASSIYRSVFSRDALLSNKTGSAYTNAILQIFLMSFTVILSFKYRFVSFIITANTPVDKHKSGRRSKERQPVVSFHFKECRIFYDLFPLNGAAWLRCQIIAHSVYPFNLIQDSIGNLVKHRPVDVFNRCSHRVHSVDRTNNDWIFVASCALLYAYRFKIRHRGKILPYLPSSPFFANSSRTIASDSRTASRRSLVIAPRQRTPSPGPGNG